MRVEDENFFGFDELEEQEAFLPGSASLLGIQVSQEYFSLNGVFYRCKKGKSYAFANARFACPTKITCPCCNEVILEGLGGDWRTGPGFIVQGSQTLQ